MVSFIGLCGGHPHLLQTYIYIYMHTGGSIEHKYLPHANAFGNQCASVELLYSRTKAAVTQRKIKSFA